MNHPQTKSSSSRTPPYMEQSTVDCPFCGYKTQGDYQIMLHLETHHPEDNTTSPFVVQEEDEASIRAVLALSTAHTPTSEQEDEDYALCPIEGCGEALLLTELESHIEMHAEEQGIFNDEEHAHDEKPHGKRCKLDPGIEKGAAFDTKLSYALRNLDDLDASDGGREKRQEGAKVAWKGLLRMPPVGSSSEAKKSTSPSKTNKRLGKSELGPHANEKQMPSWLVKILDQDGEVKSMNKIDRNGHTIRVRVCPNMAAGVVPVLAQLLEQDLSTQYAYVCDPAVKHISKLRREGGFCGYRNIQMLSSYIIDAKSQGFEVFHDKIPTIFEIQDHIERAWDLGINSQGRQETGGIRGTRKYIGTPDAQAMFCSLGIACDAQGLKSRKESSKVAYELLFQAVEQYFTNGCKDYNHKVRRTALPPIYFQHPGHSMTIVGFEKSKDGYRNLIVFDPMFHDAANVLKHVGEIFHRKHPGDLLKAYRRGGKYLQKYSEFELLKLTAPHRASTIAD